MIPLCRQLLYLHHTWPVHLWPHFEAPSILQFLSPDSAWFLPYICHRISQLSDWISCFSHWCNRCRCLRWRFFFCCTWTVSQFCNWREISQYRVCITTSLMWLLKHLSCLVVLHRGCLDKSGKWSYEMLSVHPVVIRGRPHTIFNTEWIRRCRSNKPTPQNSTDLWELWDDLTPVVLIVLSVNGSGIGYSVTLISVELRVRAFFHKTVQVCHVYCNFNIGFTCRITVIFGTLKDGSLLINTLASNICFSYRNIFQNGVDALPKIVDAFLSKSSNFHLVRIIR